MPKSQTIMGVLPFGVMLVVAVIDVLAGPSLGFLPLLTLGPTFGATVGTVRRTALTGLVALAICVPLAAYNDLLFTRQNNLTIATIAGVSGASMLVSRLRINRERELANVRLVAEVAQRVLLRPVPRRAGDLRIALSYTSAAAEAQIGGDLYEVVTTPHGVRVLIGDVQGKGLESVETAAWVLGAFREAAYEEDDLTRLCERVEASLARHLNGESFVTAIMVEAHDGEVSVLNCGHPPPLIIRSDGRSETVEPPEDCLPLGLGDLGLPGPKALRVPFCDGDLMLLYTDGVIEARDRDGVFFPLGDKLGLLRRDDPQLALDDLRSELLAHVGGPLPDDAAMLLVRR
ncbi:PP2C family protein-serine/threonine phosphatase [Streptosporangium sp. NPDC023825]|uniref:PP2C family protein-serine/threonine phosphatase n=1 Tax=Streptosporangium sp. NPDC023825 TaxID=3154909 RepID=UPI00343D4C26